MYRKLLLNGSVETITQLLFYKGFYFLILADRCSTIDSVWDHFVEIPVGILSPNIFRLTDCFATLSNGKIAGKTSKIVHKIMRNKKHVRRKERRICHNYCKVIVSRIERRKKVHGRAEALNNGNCIYKPLMANSKSLIQKRKRKKVNPQLEDTRLAGIVNNLTRECLEKPSMKSVTGKKIMPKCKDSRTNTTVQHREILSSGSGWSSRDLPEKPPYLHLRKVAHCVGFACDEIWRPSLREPTRDTKAVGTK